MIDLLRLLRLHSEPISQMWLIDILVFLTFRPRLARNIWIMLAENALAAGLFHYATILFGAHGEGLTPAVLTLAVAIKAGVCGLSLLLQWKFGGDRWRKHQSRPAYLDAAALCLRLVGTTLVYWDLRDTAGHSFKFDYILYAGFFYLVAADLIVWAGYDERERVSSASIPLEAFVFVVIWSIAISQFFSHSTLTGYLVVAFVLKSCLSGLSLWAQNRFRPIVGQYVAAFVGVRALACTGTVWWYISKFT